MTRPSSDPTARPVAHVAQAVCAITGASLAVCLCMAALGVTTRADQAIASLLWQARPAHGFQSIPLPWVWAGTVAAAALVSVVIFHTPGWWRRWVFWIAAMAVTLAWAPVLAMSAIQPALAIPCLAVLASGAGTFFYMARHPMPADTTSAAP